MGLGEPQNITTASSRQSRQSRFVLAHETRQPPLQLKPTLDRKVYQLNIPLSKALNGWKPEDLSNLCALLGIEESSTKLEIGFRFKWLYHSKTRAGAESVARSLSDKLFTKKPAGQANDNSVDNLRDMPTYTELLVDACQHMKASEEDAILDEHELFLSQAVIVAALQSMRPRERVEFFDKQIDVANVVRDSQIEGPNLSAPLTTAAMLGLAQVSGFGVYAAATTALGFLTHAVGVTLPFAIYTGMTSTIAFVIGPVGWMSAGIWGAWKMTQPKRKTIIPALVYIIAINSQRSLGDSV